jgi:dihydropteroate synthase
MGVLNITSDSYYVTSRMGDDLPAIIDSVGKMLSEGASIIDVGGMSSRPGALAIPEAEEEAKILPVIEMLTGHFPGIILSVDTFRANIADKAIRAGASIINDITGGSGDSGMYEMIARHKVPYVLMHMKGSPATMQQLTTYDDLVGDIMQYFIEKLRLLKQKGITDIIIDPGFGFAKTMEQNYTLIHKLETFSLLGRPLLVGLSRKSTLSRTINRPTEETLEATTAMHMAALLKGAKILRVHDVQAAKDAIAVYQQLVAAQST